MFEWPDLYRVYTHMNVEEKDGDGPKVTRKSDFCQKSQWAIHNFLSFRHGMENRAIVVSQSKGKV